MKNKLMNKLKRKDGAMTIMITVIIAILIPMMLFLTVDINYYMQVNRKVKQITDNMASSAASRIDPKLLAGGEIQIIYDDAKYTIYEDLMVWFNLEPLIYETNFTGVQMIPLSATKDSLLRQDLAVLELKADIKPPLYPELKEAVRVEYFIHTTASAATYYFTNGQTMSVTTPTVGIFIYTQINGTIFNLPVDLKKFSVAEAYFDPAIY